MKSFGHALFLLSLGLAGHIAWASADPAADYAKLAALNQQTLPGAGPEASGASGSASPPSPAESQRWQNRHGDEVAAAALAFIETHPTDPRRWDAVLIALKVPRSFVSEIKPGYDEAVLARDAAQSESLLVRDGVAEAAWMNRQATLVSDLLASADASPTVATDALVSICHAVAQKRLLSAEEKIRRLQGYLAQLEQRAPNHPRLASAYGMLLRLLQRNDPAAYLAELKTLRTSPNESVAAYADGLLRVEAAKESSLEMSFTAADGREVDLATLRGKVVLIDFWATWCGPCKAEIPNVVATYEKYHDKGFEIVGISLENPKFAQSDTLEQRAAKLAKAKKVLLDFTAKNGMAWPQYFDGEWWQNPLAKRHGVNAIPAMFLLDQTGKVASTNARGKMLEAEVKRLLKL